MDVIKVNLDLGDNHTLAWIVDSESTRIGAIIHHISQGKGQQPAAGLPCEGYIQFADSAFHRDHPELKSESEKASPRWQFNGEFEKPTLTPSVLCACGDHGFITDGKWVRA